MHCRMGAFHGQCFGVVLSMQQETAYYLFNPPPQQPRVHCRRREEPRREVMAAASEFCWRIQGYLALQNPPPPRTAVAP